MAIHLKFWRASLAAFILIVATLTAPSPASAAEDFSPDTDLQWDVGNADTNVGHTGQIRATVYDLEEFNGRVYAAGKFLNVFGPDGTAYDQPYLAAFDLETGVWIPSFAPQLRGPAYAIDITESGTIIAGGEIPGGLQAVDPVTGADVTSFSTDFRHNWGQPAVFDLEIVGNQIYLGGRFTRYGTTTLGNLARVDLATGALDPTWTPETELDIVTPRSGGTNVFGLAIDSSRDRVYVVGKFGGVNGDDSAFNFATLNTSDGALRTDVPQGLPAGILSHRESFSMWQHDVQFRDDEVYIGGQAHQTLILNASDLLPTRSYFTNRGVGSTSSGGDTQVIHVGKNTVWSGCHCWGALGEYPLFSKNNDNPDGQQSFDEYREVIIELRDVPGSYDQQPVSGGFGFDIETGDKLDLDFNVNGQAGAWAILEDSNGRLWMGGQYTRDVTGDRPIQSLVRFSPAGAEPPVPDNERPSVPSSGIRIDATDAESATLSWGASTDNVGVAGYRVFDDSNAVRSETTVPSTVITGLAPGTYRFYVRAFDAAGNESYRTGYRTVVITQNAPDTTRPSVPGALQVQSIQGETVSLSWSPATDDVGVVGYRLYDFNGRVLIGEYDLTAGSVDLPAGTYQLYLRAIDAAGNESYRTGLRTVTTG